MMPKGETILPEKRILSKEPKLMNALEKELPMLVKERSAPRKRLLDIGKEVGANFRNTEFQADMTSYAIGQVLIQSIASGVQPALRENIQKALERK